MEKKLKIKEPKEIDCTKCKFRCSLSISDNDRKEICHGFWRLGDYRRQKDFILMNVKSNHIKRRRPTSENKETEAQTSSSTDNKIFKRSNAKSFFLLDKRVCQTFFLKTLSISNGPLLKAFEHKNKFTNFFDGNDKRGRHQPANKLSEETVESIIAHLETFASKNSNNKCKKRIICDPEMRSLKQLYRLYKEGREKDCPSYTSFKKIFTENNFAMADHLMSRPPKKDEELKAQEEEIEYIIEDQGTSKVHENVVPVIHQVIPQPKILFTQVQDSQEPAKLVSYPVYEIQLVNFQLSNSNPNFQ